ncbi:DNAJ domain-containing protein [Schizosaccharomyces octosporus yFS286]|uniref:DNAJ domain-containing protein n=1 Tax=Schizosaccharomyces octosporus (strain yFS286) TaxID=483514 RepID=S9PS94_SCHOY|nr:DNAJ domain-containing protein [Schizosaccharomyces octosporus yFS286]EPX72026.1 DNAJ domain-containing protein [Schizosaccharomyces octosporus yFS286]
MHSKGKTSLRKHEKSKVRLFRIHQSLEMQKDYYSILNVSKKATQEEIRFAYKRAALETHPDRVSPNERTEATQRFQLVNEAFYVLGDPTRRSQYDRENSYSSSSSSWSKAKPSSSFFGGRSKDEDASSSQGEKYSYGFQESFANSQFGNIFNEMMSESSSEGLLHHIWTAIGGLAGAALGFIAFDTPGALLGSFSGANLGRIRDKHGKSAYSVFMDLPATEKARILSKLLFQILNTSKNFSNKSP